MRSPGVAVAVAALGLLALPPATVLAQQASSPKPGTAEKPPVASGQAPASSRRPGGVPQGFSVILVLGDIQGGSTSDDVPPAARKALNDMREFLPFKSFRLLDAAWVMCCGGNWESERRGAVERNRATQVLRGPDDQEYNLTLASSRDAGRVSVQFTLMGSSAPVEAVSSTASIRTMQRKIADLRDRRAVLEGTIAHTRSKVEVGTSSGTDLPKMEAELRSIDREIEDLSARAVEASAAVNTTTARGGSSLGRPRAASTPIIDTSFTMDVGETVVVGTSRQRGGSKALIALLTAVPPRPAARE